VRSCADRIDFMKASSGKPAARAANIDKFAAQSYDAGRPRRGFRPPSGCRKRAIGKKDAAGQAEV
jgi:hypothetical protein